ESVSASNRSPGKRRGNLFCRQVQRDQHGESHGDSPVNYKRHLEPGLRRHRKQDSQHMEIRGVRGRG
ncbi:MAG: hypothetical protein VB858_14340, partial [Planctomycetaceae bacterium]